MFPSNPRKHSRVPSSTSSDSDIVVRKRPRPSNDHRMQTRNQRAEAVVSKTLEAIDLTTSPPAISPDTLTTTLSTIDTLIAKDDYNGAYKALQAVTRGHDLRAKASRESWARIYDLTQLLGDGKRQWIEQARIINAQRRREMELEREIKMLASENARLRMEIKTGRW